MAVVEQEQEQELEGPNELAVQYIKFVAYSVVAYLIVAVGMLGNVLSLVVLTRPNLKGVMYVYLLGLAVSNLCALITAVPALFDISSGLGGGDYTTAFYQAHLEMPLINSFMASSVYIIIFMTVNRYISIYKPTDFQRIHTLVNARICISLSFLCGVLLHIPLCFQNKVVFSHPCDSTTSTNTTTPIESPTNITEQACGWQSIENMLVSDTYIFKAYLVVSEIFLRVGPIVTLAILNTLIIHKFLKIAKKRQSMKERVMSKPELSSAGGLSSASSSPQPSRNTSSTTGVSSASSCSNPSAVHQLAVPGVSHRPCSPALSSTPEASPSHRPHSRRRRVRALQSTEERMLVLVLISIVVLFVCCTTPAAVLSVLYSANLDDHLGFQIFRAVANNLELLNFALNFYIYCLCSAEIRRAFVSLFKNLWNCCSRRNSSRDTVTVNVDHV